MVRSPFFLMCTGPHARAYAGFPGTACSSGAPDACGGRGQRAPVRDSSAAGAAVALRAEPACTPISVSRCSRTGDVSPAARISTIVMPRGKTTRASAARSFMRKLYLRLEKPMHRFDRTRSLTHAMNSRISVPAPQSRRATLCLSARRCSLRDSDIITSRALFPRSQEYVGDLRRPQNMGAPAVSPVFHCTGSLA